jgi:cobaltochelatase CobN
MKKRTGKILAVAGLLIFAAVASIIYFKWVSPTRIGFINYPDYVFAEFHDANSSSFIKIERINWKKGEKTELGKFSAVYIFGRGLLLPPERMKALQDAVKNGLPLYIESSSSRKTNISSITGKQLEYVQKYLDNRSRTNFKLLLNYTRREIDGKKLFSDPVQEPVIIPHDGFFHIGEDAVFETLEKYQDFRGKNKLIYPGSPKICFLTSTSRPSAVHIRKIVDAFEKQKINIYPIFGFRKRLDFIRKIEPDLVVLMPHGRFTTEKENEVIDYLKKRNIPLLCPISVHAPYDEWMKDQRGMSGGIMSQSITMPELDGGVMPFVLSAEFKNEHGLYVFKELPRRVERFISTVKKYLALQHKANKDKRVIIVFYKGPGSNALVAAGLEVAPSLFNTLKNLEKAGYNVGKLPKNTAELEKAIQENASVFNPYAKGNIARFVQKPGTLRVPVKDYLKWVKDAMPADLYAKVEEQYGKAPGPYMSIDDNIVLPSLRYGNIVLMPQFLPAYGEDTNKLIHGAKQAPPHPYIAAYLWARFGYKTDAIIHFGTHGSLEFTPWKQVALSDYDWADVLMGDMPHFYFYTINDIGEAIIAKRRSYAAMISHLTPPFMSGGLYDELTEIHDKIHACLNAGDNKLLRRQYEAAIIDLVKKKKMDHELGLKNLKTLDKDSLHKIHNYIHELENAKVKRGLYVLGRKYSKAEAEETARLMAADSIAISFADIDIIRGKLTQEQKADAHYFDAHYQSRANRIIEALFKGRKVEDFVNREDLQRLKKSAGKEKKASSVNLMAIMAGMKADIAEAAENERKTSAVTGKDKQVLKKLLLKNCEFPDRLEFLRSLKNKKTCEQVLSLSIPRNRAKAERIAELLPQMRRTVRMTKIPDLLALIEIIRNPALKAHLFELLENKEIKEKIIAAQERLVQEKIKTVLSPEYVKSMYLALSPELDKKLEIKSIRDIAQLEKKIADIEGLRKRLNFIKEMRNYSDRIAQSQKKDAVNLVNILKTSEKSLSSAAQKCTQALRKASQRYSDYIFALKTAFEAMSNVCFYREALLTSTDAEGQSLVNALKGGYIAPSPGADPIRNPNSVPTGRNLYSVDTESTPTREAWQTAVQLGDALIKSKLKSKGKYPEKVAFTLWGGEFIRSHGTNVAEILYMLGVEPVWTSRGRVKDVRLIPIEKLKRPRIDVLVQTSGQFRGLATSRMYLIDKAVRLAAAADDGNEYANNVKKGTLAAEKMMIAKGYSPLDARKLATARIFGGVNGSYGAGVTKLTESGDKWEKSREIADEYMKHMGAIYTRDNWCEFKDGVFEAAMQNTDTIVQPRSSNVWGPLSLDHVYEFMGGMNLAVNKITGNNPDTFFNDLRNPNGARIQTAKEAAMTEARTTILNPEFLKEMMQEGAGAAEALTEVTRNSYGWEVMRPEMLEDYYWEDVKQTLIDDKHKLGTRKFFEQKNPYALQEMTGVMLETIRKGLWKADVKTKKELAQLHAELVKKYNAGCSGFVCDNAKLRDMIGALLDDKKLQQDYRNKLNDARNAAVTKKDNVKGMELKKQQEPKKIKELLKENAVSLAAVLGIILILIVSVLVGGRKRKEL